jgi:hypothetical protein
MISRESAEYFEKPTPSIQPIQSLPFITNNYEQSTLSPEQLPNPMNSLSNMLSNPNTVKLIGGLAALAAVYYGGKYAVNNPMTAMVTLAPFVPMLTNLTNPSGGSKKRKSKNKKRLVLIKRKKNVRTKIKPVK